MKKHAFPLLLLIYLLVHLMSMHQYGYTWDFHFHFFGGGKLLGIEPHVLEPRNLPFVEPDPRLAWTLPYGALMSIPPVASYLMFHKTLSILAADSAYHLPLILWGVAGVGILYLFLKHALGQPIALAASIFLALTPRYFGDMHNNMKDIPSAVSFALNIWLLWRLIRYKRPVDLLLSIAGFAVAFNVKINSIYIPVIFAAWLLWMRIIKTSIPSIALLYFVLAPAAAFLVWSVFWTDPIGQLDHAFRTFGIGTNNIEVLLNGIWYCSGSTVPWYYPFWYLAITTPIVVLGFFVIGLLTTIKRLKQSPIYSLVLLWFFLPLSRYLIPNIGVIDGIRHFEEVLFPIAGIAAIGLDWLRKIIRYHLIKNIIFLCCIFYLLFINITYHPYQITYFNELVGGARGAMGKYDLDYWGTSQKAAVEWVNKHAPPNAKIHIVMASAVAGQYLRPDLLPHLNKYNFDQSDFVILLNRQSFLYRFFYAYEYYLRHTPAHTIEVAGAPLTWIYDNRTNNTIPRKTPFWQGEDPCIRQYWKGGL